MNERIIVSSDHAGFEYKEKIKQWFIDQLSREFEGRKIKVKREVGNYLEVEIEMLDDEVKSVTFPVFLKKGKWDRKDYRQIIEFMENMIKEFEKGDE